MRAIAAMVMTVILMGGAALGGAAQEDDFLYPFSDGQGVFRVTGIHEMGYHSWDSVREGKPYYRVDGGIAMCHLDLAARSLGWPSAQDRIPSWHVLRVEQQARARARYRIPAEYDILGVFV